LGPWIKEAFKEQIEEEKKYKFDNDEVILNANHKLRRPKKTILGTMKKNARLIWRFAIKKTMKLFKVIWNRIKEMVS
jgi:hypothetical protein